MQKPQQTADLVELLARVAKQDRSAFSALYAATSAKLYGVVWRILPARDRAEDVLQDVYVTVWRKAGSFDPTRASPITWLVAIARNRAIDRLRSSAVSRRSDPSESAEDVRDDAPAALDLVVAAEQQERLKTCLGELEERHSAVIRSAFLDGVTYEQLAQRMEVPLGTMKSWIRRGLMKLRTCLER